MNFLGWLKSLFAASVNGPKTTSEPLHSLLWSNFPSAILPKSLPLPTSASTKKLNTVEEDFQKELDQREIKRFTAKECLFLGASNSAYKNNHLPAKALWNNFWPVIAIADEARGRIGKPLRITSGYRSPAYNKSVGGVANSQHVQFKALDLSGPPSTLRKLYAELLSMRQEGHKIAIGRYATFIHIDVRGTNASWGSVTY
jgi:uncharacterized protein YcbK (DUF882 family)